MLSRRKFLQTNAAGLALPLTVPGPRAIPALHAAQSSAANPLLSRDYWNDWPLYLTAKVNLARAHRMAALERLQTVAQVQQRSLAIRSRVWDLLGGQLEKTPLNSQQVGTVERKTYRIEKVIFESQSQVYVTAHLYVPAAGNPNARPPFPGIVASLGHTSNGKEYRNYQYAYQTLARLGYMVLAFDPFGQGERQQYLDPRTGASRYGPTGEHSQAGQPLLLLGANFAQYRAWDAIRALDYLLSRPEVDPERIGFTGHSGGGTMTMYLCALDPRIQAAVEVEGNSENFAGPHYDPPGAVADAEQNLVGGLAVNAGGPEDPLIVDRGDLLAAFAPKPLLMCFTLQDSGTTYSPTYAEGTQEIFQELKKVYGIMSAQEKVQLFASTLPHDLDFFNRRATYAWFNRWLGKIDVGTVEDEFESSPAAELNCTRTGQVLTSLGGRSVLQINRDRAQVTVPRSPFRGSPDNPAAGKQAIRASLIRLLALPTERGPLDGRILSSVTGQGMTIEEFEFHPEPEIRLLGWFIKPSGHPGPLPTVVYISEHGKNHVVAEPNDISALVPKGVAICAIDLRGLGISSPRSPKAGPLFYRGEHAQSGYAWAGLTIGKPVLGQRVWDVLRCLDYLETRSDVDQSRINLLGVAGGALAALMGGALDDRPRSIALDHSLSDFRSVVDSEQYSLNLSWFVFGILRELDLPDLVASLAPRPCWLLNSTGPRGEALSMSAIEDRYKTARDSYARLGAGDQLRFLVQPDLELTNSLVKWLEHS